MQYENSATSNISTISKQRNMKYCNNNTAQVEYQHFATLLVQH